MIKLKEQERYQEIDIYVDDTKIGDAEIELNNNELARFRIYEPYQNKGYGTKALLMLIEKYGCNNLWVKGDNERAKHVYKKCGFELKKPTVYLMERGCQNETD